MVNTRYRVSFDFDSTLSRIDVQKYAKKLVDLGYEVWVCTSRADDETAFQKFHKRDHNEDLWHIVDTIGIPRERVFFSYMKDKHHFFLQNPGFIWHMDDDVIENSLLREFGNIVTINPEEDGWMEKCESYLMYRIIFLDFDGVLNVANKDYDRFGQFFHEEFIKNLGKIINETGAKIVISSSWRSAGLEEMRQLWAERNYPGEIVDITPFLVKSEYSFDNDSLLNTKSVFTKKHIRGLEINFWLQNVANLSIINWSKDLLRKKVEESPIKNFIIIDDDSDFLIEQSKHLIKTSGLQDVDAFETFGLTERLTEEAIKILKKSLIQIHYE